MSDHQHGLPDNEEEHLESIVGRGLGDGDMQAYYPGEIAIIKSGKKYASYAGYRHGYAKNPEFRKEYQTWKAMRGRCNNPNDKFYASYGGRGITVHKDWSSFPVFLNYIGKAPSQQHSIDRIDNDGNYEPGNVRWATTHEQANNKSRNGPSKLDHEIAEKIRDLHGKGWNQRRLSELFMVSPQTINDIVNSNYYVRQWVGDKPVIEHHRPENEIEGYGEVPF